MPHLDSKPANDLQSAIKPAGRVRWGILAMLFAVTALNYADRATLSIAQTQISQTFHLDPKQMGFLFSAFAWSYVAAQLPSGWLLDRFGSRIVYFASIFLWSLFTLLCGATGFLTGGAAFAVFLALRLLVGTAEAPAFPANSRIASAWFPKTERGGAAAIFNSAQYFATVVFAPLMGWLVEKFAWPSVFYVMGALGIGASFLWLKFVQAPKQHPRLSAAELAYLEQGGALVDAEGSPQSARSKIGSWEILVQLLRNRMLLGIYLGQYAITTLTYFFITWFPTYLIKERNMTVLKAGFVASLPAIAGFLGGILGGLISDRMLKAGYSLSTARKTPIVAGMLLSMSMIACNYASSNTVVIAFMSLAFFGKGIGALGWAVVSDTAPVQAGGLSGALFNTFGNIAGITTPIVIGYILSATGSFNGALLFVGANALLAIFCYLFLVGEIRRVELQGPDPSRI